MKKQQPFYKALFTKPLLRMDLQHHAREEDDPEKEDTDPDDDDPEEKVTLTKKELEEKLQREADKRVSAALKKREDKLRKEMEEQIKKERKEAEELAKLSAEERQRVEEQRKEMDYQNRLKELEEKEQEFKRKQLELDTVDVLRERKLPTAFSTFVLGADAENTLENIVKFQEEWQQAIEAEVNKRLATGSPKAGTKQSGSYNPWKKDSFNLTEQGRIFKENPDLAKKLQAQAGY